MRIRKSSVQGFSRPVLRLAISLPGIALFASMLFWPLWNILLRSLNAKGRPSLGDGIYWGHYIALANDTLLRQVILHSFLLAALATAFTLLLAFPTAYLISRLSRELSSLMMVAILMPFWVSIIIRLFAFTTILGGQGIINSALSWIGLPTLPLLYNSFATVVGMVAYLLPYMVLILVSSMRSIDKSLLTAARTMGAMERRVFVDIYLPQVWPSILSGTLLVFVLGLGFFLTPAILGGPRDLTIPIFIQQQIQIYQWGRAAAMGIVLLFMSIGGYALALRIGGRGILTPAQVGTRGISSDEPLRFTPAVLLCWLALILVLVVLIAPLVVAIPTAFTETSIIQFPPVGFSWKWFSEVLTSDIWISAFAKSIRVALATAVVASMVGLALARVGTQIKSNFWKILFQVVAISPLIVPVILLGIGIFDIQSRLGLLGTDAGLVIAHTLLCVPLTFLVCANALTSIDPSMEQASWTMGASSLATFWRIVVPGIIPAIIGSMVISAVTSWDEAVIAMFQTQLDKTLPVTIYSFLRSGITPAVSAVATIVTLPVLLGSLIFAFRALRLKSS